jgi:amino acid adenylation domain-containing protein
MKQQPSLNEKDRHKLLYEFNNTKEEYPKDKLLHELFEEQVTKTPDNVAVVFNGNKLTYQELNERSNQLGRKLREGGVKADEIVGLMVGENSIEMIIGILAIMKAGGAFLPIDPDFPRDRIGYMIEDCNVSIILRRSKESSRIRFGGKIFDIENEWLYTGDGSNLEKISKANNLVYTIYTSGSTGKPKGVQIEHTSIVNQISGLEKMYSFDSSLHHILLAPITFDPSVQQMFLPLTSGGKLFLVSKTTKHNTRALWNFIISNRIDIVNTVPSLMNVLLDHGDGGDGLHVKYIILAGEVFSRNLYLRLKEAISADEIINIYGPTEATINTTLYECKAEEMSATIPIGKPLMNYTVLILDERLKLVPIGVAGEICISGVGLSRGYLNNHELTAEKFVGNPYKPGERMYRTGDLGKWTTDGNIEFLGRIDHQVKVHGIRVELGEIEGVLGQHPNVRETVVIDQHDHADNTRLIAYIVQNKGETLRNEELRDFLKEKLPEYMVPSAFVRMDGLPMTAHGKVDRGALPAPDQVTQQAKETFVAPGDELEKEITRIWEKVLGIQPIGVMHNFFDLGGSSLLAMVLLGQIEKLTGKYFPLPTFVAAPTVEKMASIIRKGQESLPVHSSPLVAIRSGGSKPPIFFVHGADGNVSIYRDLAGRLGHDQPVYGLQSQNLDMEQPALTSVEDMAAHFLKEIIAVQPQGPYFLGGYCLGGSIAYEIAQQLYGQGQEVALLVLMETYNWSKTRAPSLVDNVHYNIQRVEFHLRNFLLLKFREKLTFLKEKARVAKKRRAVWLGMIAMKTSHKFAFNNQQASHLYNLWKINDQAAVNYRPKVYLGEVTQFKPIKEYSRYSKRELGWDKRSAGGLKIYKLPIYPAGMLVEPFVKHLADQLKICLEEAQRKGQN